MCSKIASDPLLRLTSHSTTMNRIRSRDFCQELLQTQAQAETGG